MSDWQRDTRHLDTRHRLDTHHRLDVLGAVGAESARCGRSAVRAQRTVGTAQPQGTADGVTPAGADWLASAGPFPRSTLALWSARPTAPVVLPCGTAFDVINAPAVFGRRMLDRLWSEGPGSGPVAAHRGRMLLFAAPGTAHRLPAQLDWVGPAAKSGGRWSDVVPPLLCHGAGDAVTVPPVSPPPSGGETAGNGSRWLVAPDVRHPWLPGTEVMLWACVQAVRGDAPVAG
ncbi:bifunctional DNA primase/polymerase [Streptomyces sp. 7N604]|uniref:bifunctional DNA primase/polymerase n=1 Tax=Streptomyces sp. 7N604 TaxID=3457415 RepID=UPI003FD3E93E